MKVGVLFWGFKDINIAAESAKKLKNSHNIKEFYIQISSSVKTIALLDIFPEETIRCESDDFIYFHKWLQRNNKKNIIVVLDYWSCLFSKNYLNNSTFLKKILNEPFHFIICCPKLFHNYGIQFFGKKIANIFDLTYKYFENVHTMYEIALNSFSSISLLSYSPCISLLNSISGIDIFSKRKISILNIVPNILTHFPANFIGQNTFLEGLEKKIVETSKLFILAKSGNAIDFPFYDSLESDIINTHCDPSVKGTNKPKFSLLFSIERYFDIKSKEELKKLLWLIYLGILEHQNLRATNNSSIF